MKEARPTRKGWAPLLEQSKRGFTLIELIVVMALLGTLVMLASPNLVGQKERARVIAIRNDVQLAESKVGEQLIIDRARLHPWKMVDHDELVKLKEDEVLYGRGGPAEDVPESMYRQLTEDFVRNEVFSTLDGVFFMDPDGTVFYAEVGEGYDVPPSNASPPPVEEDGDESDGNRPITPDDEIVEGGNWVYSDFTYDNHNLTGLSSQGEQKVNNGQRNLHLPDINPYTGDAVTNVRNDAFRHYSFTGELTGPSIEGIDENGFRNGEFIGDFILPNVESIDANAFRNSRFSGSFHAPKLTSIATHAFRNSYFTGTFQADSVESIGSDAFRLSRFTGEFHAPNVEDIDGNAFRHSQFSGEFYAPRIEHIGQHAFLNSQFANGQFGNSIP